MKSFIERVTERNERKTIGSTLSMVITPKGYRFSHRTRVYIQAGTPALEAQKQIQDAIDNEENGTIDLHEETVQNGIRRIKNLQK